MSGDRGTALRAIAGDVASHVKGGSTVGLGSGSTVAGILPELVALLRVRGVEDVAWVPTSLQIQMVAEGLDLKIAPIPRGSIPVVLDGADQVDSQLNLIKGGGGALLREKVLLKATENPMIVADERKFAERLCIGGVRIPVEVAPFARVAVGSALKRIGADVQIRVDQRGYPAYSENGNIFLDALFEPVKDPPTLEAMIRGLPGVVEAGIFTLAPLTVYKIQSQGGFQKLSRTNLL